MTLFVSEVFSAIQGEAALVGERQIFVRLMGCNIRCHYCDQPEALEKTAGTCRMEQTAGRRDWVGIASPMDTEVVLEAVRRLADQVPHHSVSLTGGEPLFQRRVVPDLVSGLARLGTRVMLETNGTLPGALAEVAEGLSFVSMDLKLPSVDGESVSEATQEEFLRTCLDLGLTTWVKLVVGPAIDRMEFARAVTMLAEVAGCFPGPVPELFLQPLTPFALASEAPGPELMLELQAEALRLHPRTRVIPQTHKAIGQL
jgi:organic radical activating enzyme